MSLPRSTGRFERSDTKTLVKLGQGSELGASASGAPSSPPPVPPPLGAHAHEDATRSGHAQLWFKGLDAPVRARVEASDTSLELRAALPFLELDSVVGFTTEEGGELKHGRIRGVRLEVSPDQPVPQICIELGLSEALAAIGEADTIAVAVEPEPAAQDAPEVMVDAGRPASRRVLSWVVALVVSAAAGAAAVYAFLALRAAPPSARKEIAPAPAPAPAARPMQPSIVERFAAERSAELEHARSAAEAAFAAGSALALSRYPALAERAAETPAPGAEAEGLEPAAEAAEPEGAADVLDDTAEQDDAPAAMMEARVVATEAELEALAERAELTDSSPSEAQAETQPSELAAEAYRPQVKVIGEQTRVFIPMRGDDQGMRQSELTLPGVAVTLPSARATVPFGHYPIGRGLVRRIWLRKHGDGVQVRVITRRPAGHSLVSFDEAGLSIALAP